MYSSNLFIHACLYSSFNTLKLMQTLVNRSHLFLCRENSKESMTLIKHWFVTYFSLHFVHVPILEWELWELVSQTLLDKFAFQNLACTGSICHITILLYFVLIFFRLDDKQTHFDDHLGLLSTALRFCWRFLALILIEIVIRLLQKKNLFSAIMKYKL